MARDRVAAVAKWVEIGLVCATLVGVGVWVSVAYANERSVAHDNAAVLGLRG